MTQESEGDRSQKTVAELLAQHGASGGSRRKRHRRAAEDEEGEAPAEGRGISDTAPQAIIDRIQGEGSEGGDQHGRREQETGQTGTNGAAVPPRDEPANGRRPARSAPTAAKPPSHPPKPPHQQSGPMPRPPSPGPQPQQQEPRQQESPVGRAGSGPVAARLDGAEAPPAHPTDQNPDAAAPSGEGTRSEQGGSAPPPVQPQRGRGGLPWSPNGRRMPLRPARRGEPEPNTDQFPPVEQPQDGSAADVPSAAPPAGLARWRQRRRGRSEGEAEQTDVGAVPAVPAQADDQASASSAAPDQYDGPATGTFTPSFDTGTQSVIDDYGAEGYEGYDDFADGEDYDSAGSRAFHDGGYEDDVYEDDDFHDQDFRDEDFDDLEYSDEDDELDAGSPARQWLVLAGQLALGVVAGAGVWLGFNWLWGQMPSAALVAALIATLGLVWVVRKVRRAEDTQTTVLALLVGLVVTVSPAALLLVSR